MTLTQITEKGIKDGEILNADINASAAIAGSKIDPSFTGNITVSNTSPQIQLIDTDNNSDFQIKNNDGQFRIRDLTHSINRLTIASDGTVDVTGDMTIDTNTLHVDSSNNRVGIGTTSPSHRLDISQDGVAFPSAAGSTVVRIRNSAGSSTLSIDSNAGNVGAIQFGDTDAASQGTLSYNHSTNSMQINTGAAERMRIDSSGRLLLGTTTEGNAGADDLTIATSGSTGITVRSGTSSNGNLYFSDGTSGDDEYRGSIQYQHANNSLLISTDAVERMRIDSSGNILFGTTSSTVYDDTSGSGVVIRGGVGAVDIMRNNDHPLLLNRTGGDGQMVMFHRDGVNKSALSIRSGHLCFDMPSGTEKMRLDTSGRLMIGVAGTSHASTNADDLCVGNNDSSSQHGITIGSTVAGSIRWADSGSANAGLIEYAHNFNVMKFYTNTNLRAELTSEGMFNTAATNHGVNISTTQSAGTSKYNFRGHHSATEENPGSGTISFTVWSNGNVENTNNSYGQISDQTLKQDIVDASSQWNDIKNITVRKFRFKDNPTGELQIGVVAQEIEKVSAGLVYETTVTSAKGDVGEEVKAVKYSVLYMKAIKALQEAMTKIETLETKVAALEAK